MAKASPWIALLGVVLAAGCGGASTESAEPAGPRVLSTVRAAGVLERHFGGDADGFYLLTPLRGSWRSVVVFVHGHGDQSEITPVNHRPWLRHLVARGSAVVYPRYEQAPGGKGAAKHIDTAVRTALDVLGRKAQPIVGMGYSRGGRLVVDWAAIAPQRMKPRAILSVFPAASEEPSADYARLAPGTRILVLSGDQDEVVGPYGAADLLNALDESGFGLDTAHWTIVESTPDFTVNHLSVLGSSAPAQKRFWRPADRLIEQVS